jgi:hypothetical protein
MAKVRNMSGMMHRGQGALNHIHLLRCGSCQSYNDPIDGLLQYFQVCCVTKLKIFFVFVTQLGAVNQQKQNQK